MSPFSINSISPGEWHLAAPQPLAIHQPAKFSYSSGSENSRGSLLNSADLSLRFLQSLRGSQLFLNSSTSPIPRIIYSDSSDNEETFKTSTTAMKSFGLKDDNDDLLFRLSPNPSLHNSSESPSLRNSTELRGLRNSTDRLLTPCTQDVSFQDLSLRISQSSVTPSFVMSKAPATREWQGPQSWKELEDRTKELKIPFNEVSGQAFSDITTNPKTRMTVHYGLEEWPYNANKISGLDGNVYIASEAPDDSKTFGSLNTFKFWKMALEQLGEKSIIVDLANEEDTKKWKRDVHAHYPKLGYHLDCQNLTVSCVDKKWITYHGLSLMKYRYEVKDNFSQQYKKVVRYHYHRWPDRGIADAGHMKELVNILNKATEQKTAPIVHCVAGVGRTGTIIGSAIGYNLIQQGQITKANLAKASGEIALDNRRQRSPWFIQRPEQYNSFVNFLTSYL